MKLFLVLIGGCILHQGAAASVWYHYGNSDSNYIHNNDTITLTLSSTTTDVLRGTPGSVHQLDFIFTNQGLAGYFKFTGTSEDGLYGVLSTDSKFVSSGGQQTISVFDLTVPPVAMEGTKLSYTLTARKDWSSGGKKKREAEEDPRFYNGNQGRPDYDQAEGRQPYDEGYRPPRPGAGGGTGYFPARPGQGAGTGGTGYRPGEQSYDDPADRDSISLTIKFTVVSEDDMRDHDTSEPWITMEYAAQNSEETCQSSPDDGNCNWEWWFVKFTAADDGTGLNLIDVEPLNQRPNYGRANVYHRYENFAIGDVKEVKVIAGATCCIQELQLEVTDVAGNKETSIAYSSGTGSGKLLSDEALYGIIGGVAALVLIIVGIVVYFCCRKKYASVPTNQH